MSGLIARIRLCLSLVIAGLVLRGIAAFFAVRSTQWLLDILLRSAHFGMGTSVFVWLANVHATLAVVSISSQFLAYVIAMVGLAHLLLALALLGPYRDPLRNQWVVSLSLLCCAGAILLALIAGPHREVPVFWRLAESSFALLGALLLLLCRHYTHLLEHLATAERQRTRSLHRRRRHRKAREGRSFS